MSFHCLALDTMRFPLCRLLPINLFSVFPIPLMFLSTLSMIGLQGCTTLELPDYQAKSIDHYSASLSKNGLSVAIHPLTDVEENKKYFGVDLLNKGILPVLVMAKNQSPSSFILKKERFSLGSKNPVSDSTNDRKRLGSEASGEALSLAGAMLISLPLMFIGGKMESDATVVKQNFLVKELHMETISPGKSTQGFVYFRLPKGTAPQKLWKIHLEAVNLQSKEITDFNLSFKWNRRLVSK